MIFKIVLLLFQQNFHFNQYVLNQYSSSNSMIHSNYQNYSNLIQIIYIETRLPQILIRNEKSFKTQLSHFL